MRQLVSCFVVVSGLCLSLSVASADESAGEIVLDIREVTDDPEGVIRCGLYTKSSWLQPEDAVQWVDATYTGDGGAVCQFQGIESGTYGIGVFHDADDDHDMDSNLVGIPQEGICASNDPEGRMGPPDFEAARFRHGGERTEVTCTMNY